MQKLILIAGPCAVEDRDTCFKVAEHILALIARNKYPVDYIFKASYKKANRTRVESFKGIDTHASLKILEDVGRELNVPVLTDVHETIEVEAAASVADYLQIPAFLCRQTDLLLAAGTYAKRGVNIKKGQFMSPAAMKFQVEKVKSVTRNPVWLTERGTSFGYNDLVVDYTGLPVMAQYAPVIMDCTHATQRPNQDSGVTGGNPAMIETLACCAMIAGAKGIFVETHPEPSLALSDGANMLHMKQFEEFLKKVMFYHLNRP